MDPLTLMQSIAGSNNVEARVCPSAVMPLAVSSIFDITGVSILDEPFAVASLKEPFGTSGLKPRELVGLLSLAEKNLGLPIILHADKMTPYLRKVMLEERRPFVCEDGQFFVPGLLNLDCRNKPFRAQAVIPNEMAASTKLLYIYLLTKEEFPATVEDANRNLPLSRATIQRAFEELASFGLLFAEIGGKTFRKKLYYVPSAIDFYQEGKSRFGSAVRRTFYAEAGQVEDAPLSGLSALSHRSLLKEPEYPTVAVSATRAKGIEAAFHPSECDDARLVQVLTYDPMPLADGRLVDKFTMLLTIGSDDERIRLSIDEAMEGCEWYR